MTSKFVCEFCELDFRVDPGPRGRGLNIRNKRFLKEGLLFQQRNASEIPVRQPENEGNYGVFVGFYWFSREIGQVEKEDNSLNGESE
jgi:hypothetical protein